MLAGHGAYLGAALRYQKWWQSLLEDREECQGKQGGERGLTCGGNHLLRDVPVDLGRFEADSVRMCS